MRVTRDSLFLRGPGFNGYAYQSALYCGDCGTVILDRVLSPPDPDYNELWAYDSEHVPQPIFSAESECAQHCASCGVYLYGVKDGDA